MLELKAVKLALLTSGKILQMDKAHFQIDNMTALSYLLKMGGIQNREMATLARKIWDFSLSRKIMITAEYLPGRLNTEADWVSRHFQDSSEWLLSPRLFHLICKKQGTPSVDLFASRACHKLLLYIAWKADPLSQGIDAFQQNWKVNGLTYAFPPFSLIGKVVKKVKAEAAKMILVTPNWPTQSWFNQILELWIANPLLLPLSQGLLTNAQGQIHPLVENGT